MELYFKQRLLSFFDSFDIYDEDDNVIYTVEGQPAWLHKLHVLNAAGEHIATVRQELSLLASFELLVGEQSIGCVEQNFSLLRSAFTLDCYDWDIEGDVFGLDYSGIFQGAVPLDGYLPSLGPARGECSPGSADRAGH